MERQDAAARGARAETFAEELLQERGYLVRNLNGLRHNHPHVDLDCQAKAGRFLVSVKSAWSPNRQVRLGTPSSVETLPEDVFFFILMPATKGEPMRLDPGGYALWIVPGAVVKDEALAAHRHYAVQSPGSAHHSVMIKDKIDRSEETRSGAVFQAWAKLYVEAWHLLPAA